MTGLAVKYKGLLGGRLKLSLDAVTVRGRARYATTVGAAVPAAQNPAAALPDLIARSDNVTVAARYAVDRHSSIGLNYFYRRLSSADWAYQQENRELPAFSAISLERSRYFSASPNWHNTPMARPYSSSSWARSVSFWLVRVVDGLANWLAADCHSPRLFAALARCMYSS